MKYEEYTEASSTTINNNIIIKGTLQKNIYMYKTVLRDSHIISQLLHTLLGCTKSAFCLKGYKNHPLCYILEEPHAFAATQHRHNDFIIFSKLKFDILLSLRYFLKYIWASKRNTVKRSCFLPPFIEKECCKSPLLYSLVLCTIHVYYVFNTTQSWQHTQFGNLG